VKIHLSRVRILALATAGLALSAAGQAPAQESAPQTLANLQAAYNGESNAHAKYLAFAERAEQEGYARVASLFRAAARAEEVHARNHAAVIEQMGATPTADIQLPEIKSTSENLQAAIEGESYERDTMYPGFVETARGERNTAALRSFNYALTAEAEHARLYQQALDNLEEWRSGPSTWYVCQICGWTTAQLPAERCPSCFNGTENYVEVS
jgi:rubrerythrin